jgi:hypothetical protein
MDPPFFFAIFILPVLAIVSGFFFWRWLRGSATSKELEGPGVREFKSSVSKVTIVTIFAASAISPTNLLAFFNPPAALLLWFWVLSWHFRERHFAAFYSSLTAPIAVAGMAAYVAALIINGRSPFSRPGAWTIAAIAFWFSFWIAADINIRRIQAQAWTKLGLQCVDRRGILGSAQIAGAEFQFYYHALGFKDREPFAWSFSEMAFFPLPHSVARNVAEAAYRRCFKEPSGWNVDN